VPVGVVCGWLNMEAGRVVYSEVYMEPNGRSKGCGVVEFADAESARRAIDMFHEKDFMGRRAFLREDREQGTRVPPIVPPRGGAPPARNRESAPGCQLFVGNVRCHLGSGC